MTTLGEYRVGISFNPSASQVVDTIKQAAADFIDICANHRADNRNDPKGDGETDRLWALAMTEIESAAMWAVKAATKKPL